MMLREHKLEFFQSKGAVWRLSLEPAAPMLDLSGSWLLDWGGAQRWLISDEPAEAVFQSAASFGGHATLFRSNERSGQIFHPLTPPLAKIHRQLKRAFDPKGIFNPYRMYREW